jgi:hypothetical protein
MVISLNHRPERYFPVHGESESKKANAESNNADTNHMENRAENSLKQCLDSELRAQNS